MSLALADEARGVGEAPVPLLRLRAHPERMLGGATVEADARGGLSSPQASFNRQHAHKSETGLVSVVLQSNATGEQLGVKFDGHKPVSVLVED